VYFNKLIVSQFRNYIHLEAGLGMGINIFSGPNGSGKTSILEALNYLCMARGFSAQSDRHVLKNGEQFFIVEGQLSDDAWVKCTYLEGRGKKIFHDQVPLEKISAHIGRIPVVSVLPNDTDLIRESGTTRRKYLDALISQYDAEYLQALVKYEQALAQRNAALTQFLKSGQWDAEQIHIWEPVLIKLGMRIHAGRKNFLEAYIPVFKSVYQKISGTQEIPDILFDTKMSENTEVFWKQMYRDSENRDRASGRTQVGTHREDLIFLLETEPIRERGSQGQQKSFVLALKLSNFIFLKQQKNDWPVLLLDDIFDKLDHQRVEALALLLKEYAGAQILLTDTSELRIREIFDGIHFDNIRYFSVMEGQIQEQ